ncbi:MAG: transcriptional regulator [Phenylobacterium sp.]
MINNEQEYEDALERINEIWEAEEGTAELEELFKLIDEVEIYEDAHYPIE